MCAFVTQELIDTWYSGEFVGANTPQAVAQIQRGYWQRAYRLWTGPPVRAQIWGEGGYGDDNPDSGYWFPEWVATTDWIDLPNLYSIKRTKDFGQNGVTVLELVVDAQDYVPTTGALGDAFHVIQPGQLAAERGVAAQPTRRDSGWQATEWTGIITDSIKIRVWQGFGAPQTGGDGAIPPVDGGVNGAWTFAGQVDDVDLDSDPNQITMTARNGKLLTDQRTFGWAKSKRLPDPIAFFDTDSASTLTMVGKNAAASSSAPAQSPQAVLDLPKNPWNVNDPAYQTAWSSGAAISDTNLEWLDIRLPQGTYDEAWLQALTGMFTYVGIFAHSIVHYVKGDDGVVFPKSWPPRMDGRNQPPGWIDVGNGNAPGANGGWPWIRTFTTGANPPPALPGIDRIHLEHSFDLGERSILRLGFIDPGNTLAGAVATVGDLHGLRRKLIDDVEDQRYILVPDASEVVKVVLRWAGFQEWDVEEALVRISDGTTYNTGLVGASKQAGWLIFNRATYLIDIVKEIAKQLGFIFFIADPTDANSNGVPTFRRDSSLLVDNGYVSAEIRDDLMLTGLKRKNTDADRPFIIRVRGKTASASAGGVPLGGETIRRIMAVYTPPWAFGDRAGGIVRHMTYQDDQLITYAMCLMGCYLIALNAALQMYTVTLEIPAHPIIELDDQVSVVDEPTGTNSRMWVIKSEDTMQLGEGASWKQTLDGSLIDTADFWQVMDGYTPPGHQHIPGVLEVGAPAGSWQHVSDPNTGQQSGYISPAQTNVHRTPRTR